MKKQDKDRSGVIRCQRCFKYGHYTYECQNDVAYRYRPSRTIMFKQKIKLQLNKDKGPKTVILNPDYKRRVFEDKPSSQSQKQQKQPKQQIQNPNIKWKEKNLQQQNKQNQIQQKQHVSSQSEQSQDSSSSQSSDSSSSFQSSQQSKPRKIRKLS